jgi:hypothetical protein
MDSNVDGNYSTMMKIADINNRTDGLSVRVRLSCIMAYHMGANVELQVLAFAPLR